MKIPKLLATPCPSNRDHLTIRDLPNLPFIIISHRFGTTTRLSPQIDCRWRIPLA
jgi:hypothetical protein